MTNRRIVSKIRYLRDQIGLTQTDLAELIQVNQNTIANWERGRVSLSCFKQINHLCLIFECSPSDLYDEVPIDEFKESQRRKTKTLDQYRALLGTEIPSSEEKPKNFG